MLRRFLLSFLMLTMVNATFVATATNPSKGPPAQQKNPVRTLTTLQMQTLESYGKNVLIEFDSQNVPSYLMGQLSIRAHSDAVAEANAALDIHGNAFSRGPDDGFTSRVVEKDQLGMTHVRMAQTYKGLPVVGAELVVHLTEDKVVGINGQFVPDLDLKTQPLITADQAAASARSFIESQGGRISQPAETRSPVVVVDEAGTGRLAIPVHIVYSDSEELEIDDIFVDAENGAVLKRHPLVWRAKGRKIFDGSQVPTSFPLPGEFIFGEGDTSSDSAAMGAYDGTGTAYDFYKDLFNRDSFDNVGGDLVSTVHFGRNVASWLVNEKQMLYGDGDGVRFSSLANGLDVVAHELTHGVTANTANLIYEKESGALNEATSDILGEATAFWAGQGDWKIGTEVYTPAIDDDALRYMYDPALDMKSVDDYRDLDPDTDVHYNSGIGNLFFYLLSQGGSHPRNKTDVVVPAIGINKAQAIWYRALAVYMTPTTNFQAARTATALAAADLFGDCGRGCSRTCTYELVAVQTAWDAVGVPGTSPCVTTQLLGNPGFESGAGTVRSRTWRATPNVITDDPGEGARSGSWKAWLDGYGKIHTDTLAQTVTIPSDATSAALTFWLHIVSDELTEMVQYDKLSVQIRTAPESFFPEGRLLETLTTYSNLDRTTSYTLRSFDLTRYKGQTIQIYFHGKENENRGTSFVIDDTALKVSRSPLSPIPPP